MDASGAWLAFVRGFNDSLLGHTSIAKGETLHVLYAAGSLAPSTCTEDFDMTMIHNIGHGSAAVPALALGSGTIAAELADPITPEHARSVGARHSTHDLSRLQQQKTKTAATVAFFKHGPERAVRVGQHPGTGKNYTVLRQTIHSEANYLANGDVIFTVYDDTVISMPEGDYAMLSIRGELVDCNNVSVPLTTVYNHHWVLKPISGPTTHTNFACDRSQSFTYVFGIGPSPGKPAPCSLQGTGTWSRLARCGAPTSICCTPRASLAGSKASKSASSAGPRPSGWSRVARARPERATGRSRAAGAEVAVRARPQHQTWCPRSTT